MVRCKNRIPYWIDWRLTGLAEPDYGATISFGLPIEPEDSQYGKYRFNGRKTLYCENDWSAASRRGCHSWEQYPRYSVRQLRDKQVEDTHDRATIFAVIQAEAVCLLALSRSHDEETSTRSACVAPWLPQTAPSHLHPTRRTSTNIERSGTWGSGRSGQAAGLEPGTGAADVRTSVTTVRGLPVLTSLAEA